MFTLSTTFFKKFQKSSIFFNHWLLSGTDMPAKPLVYWLSAHLHCNQKAKTYYYILIFISIRAIFLSAKISYIEKHTQTSNTTYCVGQFQVMCCFIIWNLKKKTYQSTILTYFSRSLLWNHSNIIRKTPTNSVIR